VLLRLGCFRVRRRLTEYVDGCLSAREEEAVRAHLAICPACRKVSRDLALVKRALSSLPSARAGPQFLEGVWGRIEAGRVARQPRRSLRLWRLLLPVPALTFLLFLAFLLLRAPVMGKGGQEGQGMAPPLGLSEVHTAYEAAYPISNLYAVGTYMSAWPGEG